MKLKYKYIVKKKIYLQGVLTFAISTVHAA